MNLLEVENISKSYSNHHALKNICLEIPKGSIFGLLGPNGAGKTTLIRIITQIISQDKGRILLKDKEITMSDVRKIGYLPEERGLYKKMKVGEQLIFLGGLKGMSGRESRLSIKKWFEKLEITNWGQKKIEDLSKGMSQKIQFIATVMHNPDLLILDEPFSGFDPVNAQLIKDNILELKEQGTTIIFSTHRMESVEEMCDHVAMIHQSEKILDGKKNEIKDSFKENIFEVMTDGQFELPDSFKVLSQKEHQQKWQSSVKMNESATPNQLLEKLISQTQVHQFAEKIPSMNEIFIKKIKEGGSHA